MTNIRELPSEDSVGPGGSISRMMLVAAVLFAGIGTAVWVGYWVNADAEKDWRIEAQREAG